MSNRWPITLLSFSFLLVACDSSPPAPSWDQVAGRDHPPVSYKRYPTYRLIIPAGWQKIPSSATESLADTRLPLVEYQKEGVKFVIHNFPLLSIAPAAQVSRWERQYPEEPYTQPMTRCGFQGLYYEGQKGEEGMFGWAFSLDSLHHQALERVGSPDEHSFYQQMQADVTLKATGNQEALLKLKHEICKMAHSFELIQEIPCDD